MTSKSEEKCREIIERYYGKKFNSCWPSFLRNPETQRCLQLDMYNEELKLAFEYQGEQHYIFPNRFNQTDIKKFHAQVRRDQFKKDKCAEMGITLIRIPYTFLPDLESNILTLITINKKKK